MSRSVVLNPTGALLLFSLMIGTVMGAWEACVDGMIYALEFCEASVVSDDAPQAAHWNLWFLKVSCRPRAGIIQLQTPLGSITI